MPLCAARFLRNRNKMLLSKDINPKRDLYYLGGVALRVLAETPTNTVDFFSFYKQVCEVENIALKLFIQTIDWLFILGALDINKKGEIQKCF